ncbi:MULTISPECIES: hypothetical protein [Bacillus]|uniref:Uncharacterized protein n=2 Tax=Bacillus TaxID=1386 RepID=A0A0M3R911_9BACI|nr:MULTISPECIES: hypothetical protein [Bacillus]ALC80616.1 hypothetical protein AM592_02730 [Bacillus gobiensis]MBP1083713.1 hypothetical protein [Bacillus capparidis]MED1094901.1 hypothetical protein [Bacillus capparidis]
MILILSIIGIVCFAGSLRYLHLLGAQASYPPKHVLRQKATMCATGLCIALLLILLLRLL